MKLCWEGNEQKLNICAVTLIVMNVSLETRHENAEHKSEILFEFH